MIPGIVLAAGLSSRMGRPKALLPAGDAPSFIDRILSTLRQARLPAVYVVFRPGDEALVDRIRAHEPFARPVANPRAEDGQLSSLIAGLDAADGAEVEGALVTLVDVPLIRVETVVTILERFGRSQAPLVRPQFAERHGHPAIFRRTLFDELRRADPSLGAKPVLAQHAAAIENVIVDDPGTVRDVDDVEDYVRLFGRHP